VFNAVYDGTFNLETFSLDSAHEERDVAASPTATETWGRFSPDGRSIAYGSDESGRVEVYIRPFPDAGGRVQVSAGGGTRAIWAPDGKTLYYRDGTKVMAATLTRDPALRVASRALLFDGPYAQDFDLSRDGTRFLMIEAESSGLHLLAVPNWRTELRQLTGARTR
jgi:serine/threonine-protein kinase